MKTPEQILHKYFHHFTEKRTRDLVVKAMQEYADQQSDAVHELFMRPQEVLKPLQDLWRKENSPDRFVIPDATEFFKWIVKKINDSEAGICKSESVSPGRFKCKGCGYEFNR